MAAQHLSGQNDWQEHVLDSDQPVLVDFHAEWCGPCKLAEPIMEQLSEEYNGKAKVVKIDTDDPANRPIAMGLGVMSIPTVMLYKGGSLLAKQIGFIGEDGYRQMLEQGLEEATAKN